MITVRSVPSTGTNFVLNLLRSNGLEAGARHFKRNISTPKGLIVSPIRDPFITWQTWVLAQRGPPYTGLVAFEYAWDRLNDLYLTHSDFFLIPVDAHDRIQYLRKLEERLGQTLNTDWFKVNHTVGDRRGASVDLSAIYSLPVVRDVYKTEG